MVRTEFLSQQWSIQESDIDWVYEEDGQSTLGQGQKKKKVIGEGSFGKIYLGEYQGLKCAIKEIKIKNHTDEDEVEDIQQRFLMELQLVMELRHPNILNTMGGMWEGKGQDSKNLIVSEFCQLGDLKGVLKRMGNNIFWTPSIFTTREGRSAGQNTLTSKAGVTTNKIDWAGQISLGLTYLHGRKPAIMHRDLKCANILVDKGFKMKITDFGESRHTAEGEMTMTGTAYFMAPEVFAGNGRYDEKCDVYSFAMLLLEIHNNGDISKYFHTGNSGHGKKKTSGQILHDAANGWRPNLEDLRRPETSQSEKEELLKNKPAAFKRSNTGRRDCDDHLYMPDLLIEQVERMWDQDPDKRPTMAEVSSWFKKVVTGVVKL